jgi:TDG/mug DNA glycosylase family protein
MKKPLQQPILPDVLRPGLKVVFCGTAAGTLSAQAQCYYAAPGNKFWRTLYQVGLTPRQLTPAEFPCVTQFEIGLTDLKKNEFGADSTLSFNQKDRELLRAKLLKFAPKVVAFNSKNAAEKFLNHRVSFGLQDQKIGESVVFVLPSTSGLACRSWDQTVWMQLSAFLIVNCTPLRLD